MNIAPQNWSELRKTHEVVQWPQIQQLMDYKWFNEEALLLNSPRQTTIYGNVAYLIPKNRLYLRLRIDDKIYKISKEKPVKGDYVFDLSDYCYGIHDGECAGRILVRDNNVVEGCLPKQIKKLVLDDENISN